MYVCGHLLMTAALWLGGVDRQRVLRSVCQCLKIRGYVGTLCPCIPRHRAHGP